MRYIKTTFLALGLAATLLSGCGGVSSGSSSHYTNDNSDSDYSADKYSSDKNIDITTMNIDYQDSGHIILSWEPVEGVDKYEVRFGQDFVSAAYTIPITVEKPEINIAFLSEGTWWFNVKVKGSKHRVTGKFTITTDNAYLGG